MKRFALITAVALLLQACGGSDSSGGDPPESGTPVPQQCLRSVIEANLDSALQVVSTDVDFSFYLEDINGDSYEFNRGSSTLQTPYESASTSKWVSAAIIMQLVDVGLLSLDDSPQDFLNAESWPVENDDPLAAITLRQLLSFTSGLTEDALCSNLPNADYFACVATTAERNIGNGEVPGETFNYGSAHLQVAGAMAIEALDESSWAALFTNFKSLTGLFPNSSYNLPSTSNPRLAGGMTWTAEDYINFIRAFRDVDFYTSDMVVNQIASDQLSEANIGNSPALSGIGEDWHYGFGVWIECHQNPFSESACTPEQQISSPGAYGAYPFLNREEGYFGIVARQGELGTFREGYALFDGVRDLVEDWAACSR